MTQWSTQTGCRRALVLLLVFAATRARAEEPAPAKTNQVEVAPAPLVTQQPAGQAPEASASGAAGAAANAAPGKVLSPLREYFRAKPLVEKRSNLGLRRMGIGLTVGGLLVAVAGALLESVAISEFNLIGNAPPGSQYDPVAFAAARQRGLRFQGGAIAAWAVGGAAAVSGIVLLVVNRPARQPAAALSLRPIAYPGSSGLAIHWSY